MGLNISEKLVFSYDGKSWLSIFPRSTTKQKNPVFFKGQELPFVQANILNCLKPMFLVIAILFLAPQSKTTSNEDFFYNDDFFYYYDDVNIHVEMMWILKINSEALLVGEKNCRVSNLRIWFYCLSLLAFMRFLIRVFVMVKSGLMKMLCLIQVYIC